MDVDEFDEIPDEDLLALVQATETSNTDTVRQNGSRDSARTLGVAQQPVIDIDSDDFSSDIEITPQKPITRPQQRGPPNQGSQSFRQTTLWGTTLNQTRPSQPQSQGQARPFRSDLPPEVPTHHELDQEALSTWVYPLNLGAIRDYQFSIVKNGLFHNTLVALPTGLGKTFIAATIMLNFLRWTTKAKVIFVAPTKPLASQQVQACLAVAGIPRSQATLLTGETPPALRAEEWKTKRLFFMTPQTLNNDLSKGYANPKDIVLLVVDEAHRSTGDYAYVKVVEFIRRFSSSFRVLALTATPGSSVEAVQDVIDNLGISHVEIRTEESIDIRQYVHSREIDTVTLEPSEEMEKVKELFSKAIKPLVDKLSAQNIYFGRDPMSITTYGLLKSKNEWLAGAGKHANQGLKFMMLAVFGILQSLAHAVKLLNFHGIKPFYNNLQEFRITEEGKKGQGSKFRKQVLDDENFQEMMKMIEGWMKQEEFYGHPKLLRLCETLVTHFVDAGEGSGTRAIVFSEYRDSAEEIVRLLNKQPMVKATVFVGQADSKRSEGMKQKQQIETIDKFRSGTFNVLVATSIGEEGLDIGQVDLIVCYDASASPIRMLQRMGRTGRKRAGKIVLLLMKGREEDKFQEAKLNYEKMQEMICEGSRFTFRHDLSSRIVPRNIKPEVDKRLVEIPIENTQNPDLPEPKKTAAALRKKAPPKKFNMPDNVETGFVKASVLTQLTKGGAKAQTKVQKKVQNQKVHNKNQAAGDGLVPIPDFSEMVLSETQAREFSRLYRDLPFGSSTTEDVSAPVLVTYPEAQRGLRPSVKLNHGEYTKRCVKLLKRMGQLQNPSERDDKPYGEVDTSGWQRLPMPAFANADSDSETEGSEASEGNETRATLKRPRTNGQSTYEQDIRPRKRQAASKTSTSGSKIGRAREISLRAAAMPSQCDEVEEDEDEDDEEELDEPESSLPTRPGRGRQKQKPVRGSRGRQRVNNHTEDVGDDCMRTSDMEESDGSDSGGDLVDFVVSDNHVTSSMQRRSTSPASPGPSAAKARRGKAREQEQTSSLAKKPFYKPTHFSETEGSSDSDIPDLAELLSRVTPKKNPRKRPSISSVRMDADEDEDDAEQRPSPRGGKHRRIIADSDDD